MSYQVLARKWRPKSFGTLVGQEHVVRALSHALATGRLHHAWLFTGTRGVGKTTISRILAKALNCEQGVSAEPCGACAACVAIDADRFPDYVEMDAASNRGVDDMAALLDQAVYAPVQGRYKVYMIDEVHMLTGHAFNAMLKTLEEPPAHLKFILATTDPQKMPVTVLSRCLQFNLKQMPQGHIVDHLGHILQQEGVVFEPAALRHVARAANGSMRDALSLLDQAIAHGAGTVVEEQVSQMLGMVGDDHLFALLDALLAGDAVALLSVVDQMIARSLSPDAALHALASLLQRMAVAQFAPSALADEVERARLAPYVSAWDPEYLQLAYQMVIHGRSELSLAPDEQAGFTMTMLRLLAFRPEQPLPLGADPQASRPPAARPIERAPHSEPVAATSAAPSAMPSAPVASSMPAGHAVGAPPGPQDAPAAQVPESIPAPAVVPTPNLANAGRGSDAEEAARPAVTLPAPADAVQAGPVGAPPVQAGRPATVADVPPWEDLPEEAMAGYGNPVSPGNRVSAPARSAAPAVGRSVVGMSVVGAKPEPGAAPHAVSVPEVPLAEVTATAGALPAEDAMPALKGGDWHAVQQRLGLKGMVRELAQHCEWRAFDGRELGLRLSHVHRHLYDMNPGLAERIAEALGAVLGQAVRVRIEIGEIEGETPAQRIAAEKDRRRAEAVAALEEDPFVRGLIDRFDASLLEASVRPVG
ncbi:MAG: DNA polymerase III subunit gamma/tau [Rhodocyclaceae bacterium]